MLRRRSSRLIEIISRDSYPRCLGDSGDEILIYVNCLVTERSASYLTLLFAMQTNPNPG